MYLSINNSVIKYKMTEDRAFDHFHTHRSNLDLPFTLVSHSFYSPIRHIFAKYAPIYLTRECFDSIFAHRSFHPFTRIVNNPSLKRGAKGMDVCTCFHGQRNDENHELGNRSTLHASSCFTIPLRVINRGWPA